MTFAIEFDFNTKQERPVALEEIAAVPASGLYYWIDLEGEPKATARGFLERMNIDPLTLDLLFDDDTPPRFNVFSSCLHFMLKEARVVNDDWLTVPVQVVLGSHFMLTSHPARVEFLADIKQTYKEDFHEHSHSPGFLLFELADHLTQGYRLTLNGISEMIEGVQAQILGEAGSEMFHEVNDLIRWLLEFRKIIIATREIVHELATRKSPFVSESTRPFLEKKGVLLDRLSTDVTTEREVLSESLNLFMGIVSYRTNRVVTKLTMVSMFFLPLSFLVGLYGMNFGSPDSTMPELGWKYGYVFFWCVVATIVGSLVYWMRRNKWF
ncbi:magnesium transporter CorA family protein [Marinobacterium rhizophilum]|uniref:magnesium transporter CorA family protein n=1 Tax=Marinobacterium rhizophilum TaxID=420402 RepID=UPI00037253F6|nr:CorA family divalent cation transporter [Marinobacterium rhizophilum]